LIINKPGYFLIQIEFGFSMSVTIQNNKSEGEGWIISIVKGIFSIEL